MLNFGDRVFVVTSDKIIRGSIYQLISHKGVVTGYNIHSEELASSPLATKFVKKDIFIDEEKAKKALFKKKLKKQEKAVAPAEDKIGDRRWISGYKKNGYGQYGR